MTTLDPVEARVLGVLVEKQMTTPDAYPLTLAGVVAGCNQSTNRDPVMDLAEDEVERTLVRLHDRQLATPVRRPGDRATKYRHKLVEAFDLVDRAVAVLAVLLLRGAQTTGELRQRTDRYVELGGIDEIEEIVDELETAGLAHRLERRPGQSQRRVGDLLTTPPGDADEPSDGDGPVPREEGWEGRVTRLEERFEELLRRLGVDDL